jgi:hypothetical protein
MKLAGLREIATMNEMTQSPKVATSAPSKRMDQFDF